jgi:hypothetical protein
MCGFGFALPLLLIVGGLLRFGWLEAPLAVQDSLSAYYHAGHRLANSCTQFAGDYRDLFVGLLAAISFCLIIYTGFGKLENWLLNGAGLCLAGVAFFPTDWPGASVSGTCLAANPGFQPFLASKLLGLPVSVHVVSAIGFFLLITLVNVLTAMDTVDIIQNRNKQEFWHRIFRVARWLMPMALGFVLALRLLTGTFLIGKGLVLWLETAGILAFSFYWLLKSIEILSTRVDVAAVNGRLEWKSPKLPKQGPLRSAASKRHLEYIVPDTADRR